MTTEADPARFAHVTDWVFDLDNTLYPHHSNLFSQIDVKMTAYVSELLKLPREAARKLQKELYLEYGTTLNGLMNRHGIDPDDFLEKVHDIDYSWLKPDPVLGAAIRQLPGPQVHLHQRQSRPRRADGAAARHPRPFRRHLRHHRGRAQPRSRRRETYDLFLASYGVAGPNAVMFEDLARNLAVPKALGMTTVLIVPHNFEPTFSEIWERDAANEDDVDFVTDDLAGFLVSIMRTADA